jgi:hypothetical protein
VSRTVGDGTGDLGSIIAMVRQKGYMNEIPINLNIFSNPTKFIFLVMPLGTKYIAILYNEVLEGDVNQIVQGIKSLRPDIVVMRFVDNELDPNRILVAFKTD